MVVATQNHAGILLVVVALFILGFLVVECIENGFFGAQTVAARALIY